MQSKEQIIVLLAVFSLLFGFVGAWAYSLTQGTQTNENLVFEYYQSENAVSVSPTDFIREMQNGRTPGLAVDLRSAAEYEKAHLASSVNIPASGMTPEQLVAAFKALPQDKPIITYCYSSYCMLSRKVGKTLSENGVFVKHFTAGWYEINRDYSNYTVGGIEPGVIVSKSNEGFCPPGEFSC